MLCIINKPGWPYQCYLEAKDARSVKPESQLSVNGAVEFSGKGQPTIQIPHKNPDEVQFPLWQRILPDASTLVPIGTFNAGLLKKLLTALQRDTTSSVSIYARSDNRGAPILLANEAGDAGVIMPLTPNDGLTNFPNHVYEAAGLSIQTDPPLAPPHNQSMDGILLAEPPPDDQEE